MCISSVTTLTHVFRQKEQCASPPFLLSNGYQDVTLAFVTLLNEMRFGKLSAQNQSRLKALSRQVRYRDLVEPTELYAPATLLERCSSDHCFSRFPTKREVQFANDSRLSKLTGPVHTFRATDQPGKNDKDQYITYQQATAQLDRCVLAPELMTLKVGNSALHVS